MKGWLQVKLRWHVCYVKGYCVEQYSITHFLPYAHTCLCPQSKIPGIGFLKIHAPWNVLCREAEFMKLKMPTMKVFHCLILVQTTLLPFMTLIVIKEL